MQLEYGIPQDKGATHLQFGLHKGFFREEGIDLQFRIVFGGPEIAACYDSGELSVGEMGSPPATAALAKGARFRIIASGVRRQALQYFVARPDIADWNGVRDKTVGVLSKGSCSYWFSRLVLEQHGLDPDRDVEIVGLGKRHPDVIEMFESGELQAAVISEPAVSIGESLGAFRILKALNEPEYCPTMQWSVAVANIAFMAKEPQLISALLRACRKSYHYASDHEDEFAAFGASHYGIDHATMLSAIRREEPNLHYDCKVDMQGLDIAIDLQRRLGAFTEGMRATDITDLRFVPA